MSNCNGPLSFVLNERLLTITVVASAIIFALIGALKRDIMDPFVDFMMPDEHFRFMDITIRDGEAPPEPNPKKIQLRFGDFFKELITALLFLSLIFLLSKYVIISDPTKN